MLYLRIVRSANKQENLSIPDKELPFTIGRDKENKLHIDSTAVSRFHAVLFSEKGEYFVQDMESTNGTFLNDKKIKKSSVQPGDRVTVANVDIVVQAAPAGLQLPDQIEFDRPLLPEAVIQSIRSVPQRRARNGQKETFVL